MPTLSESALLDSQRLLLDQGFRSIDQLNLNRPSESALSRQLRERLILIVPR
jgi:hypothetical protein